MTDKECRAAKAGPKPVKLFDAHGLHLLISTTGHKSWRLKYRIGGKEKQISFGAYPDVRLADARDMSAVARRTLSDGVDPALEFGKKAKRRLLAIDPAMTFESVARAWHDERKGSWKPRYAREIISSLERDIFPTLGYMDVRKIRAKNVREVLKRVQDRGALETGHRLLQRIFSVYEWAIAEELAEVDPTTGVTPALKKVVKRRQPAVLSIPRARAFLRAYEATPGHPGTKLASRLLALTAARPGMVQLAERVEFHDLDGRMPTWTVPAEKMKLRLEESEEEAFDFTMPLSRQAVAVVKAALKLAGKGAYLFPSVRHPRRPISSNALNVAYRRVGGWEAQHVPHGWRASFSTIMNERLLTQSRKNDWKVIELMLAHVTSGVRGRYDRGAYMPRRRQIAQEWADLLCVDQASIESLLEMPRR